MPQRIRKRPRNSQKADNVTIAHPPYDLASRIRGLYRRVADRLGLDASYISRVARGERRSEIIEAALRSELIKIANSVNKQRVGSARKAARKRGVAVMRVRRRRK
jgi:hypothetical protein